MVFLEITPVGRAKGFQNLGQTTGDIAQLYNFPVGCRKLCQKRNLCIGQVIGMSLNLCIGQVRRPGLNLCSDQVLTPHLWLVSGLILLTKPILQMLGQGVRSPGFDGSE